MSSIDANRRDFLRWLALSGAGLAAAGIAPAVFAQEAAAAGTDIVVLLGATVVDGTDRPPREHAAVVLVGDRIAWVGEAGHLPKLDGAQVIDVRGKFVIPGLTDMHTHGSDFETLYPPLHIANGVTAVREMWGYPENHATRDKIERGELIGPRMIMASHIIDGPVTLLGPPVVKVATEAEARQAVRDAKAQGADFVKVYSYLPPEAFAGIVAESRVQGLPIAGHWPYHVPLTEASAAGQRSFEHLFGLPTYTSSRRDEILATLAATPFDPAAPRNFFNLARELERQATLAYSPSNAAEFFERLICNGTSLSPTFAVLRAITSPADRFLHDPRLKYMSAFIQQFWADRIRLFAPVTPEEIAQQDAFFQALLELVGAAHRAGVGIIGGTDCLNPYDYPGFSLHDELDFLTEAGLPPRKALQSVTRDAARFLGREATSGTVAPGKVADLVVLDANPLQHVNAVRRINTVITRGRVLDRARLDQMLADVEAAAQAPATAARAILPVHNCC